MLFLKLRQGIYTIKRNRRDKSIYRTVINADHTSPNSLSKDVAPWCECQVVETHYDAYNTTRISFCPKSYHDALLTQSDDILLASACFVQPLFLVSIDKFQMVQLLD